MSYSMPLCSSISRAARDGCESDMPWRRASVTLATLRAMSDYAAAHLTDIDEIDDGRCAFRPIRLHFGITSFAANAWTGRNAGDRIINEHDEAGEVEELYVVQSGRATFELDGERVDAPAGTFVVARPGVKRTAFAEEPDTTILAVGGAAAGQAYEPDGWELWTPFNAALRGGTVRGGGGRGPCGGRRAPRVRGAAVQPGLLREPRRRDRRGDRASRARDRPVRAVPRARRPRFRLRSRPRRAGVPGPRRALTRGPRTPRRVRGVQIGSRAATW